MNLSIKSLNYIFNQVSFGEYSKVNHSHNNEYDYMTTTEFFRDDFDWNGFFFFISDKYKNTSNVHVVSYGCSDGEETYSFALRLKYLFKNVMNKNTDKFLPIVAKDIDSECIMRAKRGCFKISAKEKQKIEALSGNDLFRYIDIYDDGLERYAFVKDSLKSCLNFSCADIREDIDKLDDKNNILICRNFLHYLPPNNQVKIIDKISKKLDNTSLLVLGSSDKSYGIDKMFLLRGFEETGIENVLQKRKVS